IPFALGGFYGLYKSCRFLINSYYSYERNKLIAAQKSAGVNENDLPPTFEQEVEAQKDACKIMHQVTLRRRYELAKSTLVDELGAEYKEQSDETKDLIKNAEYIV